MASSVAVSIWVSGAVLWMSACGVHAETFSGNLGDSGNAALVGSDLGAAQFADPASVANNVALYSIVLPSAGMATIRSTGFAAGGVDPYFSLFAGAGLDATFVDSNYAQAYSSGGDFVLTESLAAGSYRLALGAFANQSFAENLGVGTLADGFTQLGESYSLGNGGYSLTVSFDNGGGTPVPTPVPEPTTPLLMLGGLVVLAVGRRVRANA